MTVGVVYKYCGSSKPPSFISLLDIIPACTFSAVEAFTMVVCGVAYSRVQVIVYPK